MKTYLLIIDAQHDFCDKSGALFVPGAPDDCERLGKLITRAPDLLDDLWVSLDSHQPVHIAHPLCWVDKNKKHPDPFTLITVEDVEKGVWRASNLAWQKRQLAYVRALASGGRYVLVIWPPHCLIGSVGASLVPSIGAAIQSWQEQFNLVEFVTKGSNPLTEHYSVVRADVVDPGDRTTDINMNFIQCLQEADRILVGGQALSHCVANTLRDIATEFGDEHVKKIVLLTDACSSVPGYEKLGEDFIKEMKGRGMQLAKTTDF